jgi:hypothetical protein
VLGQATPRQMPSHAHPVPGLAQGTQHRLRGRRVVGRTPGRLVAHHQAERVLLRGKPGEGRRQLDGPVAGGDEDVQLWRHHDRPALIRPTIAVVEWSDR